MRSLFFKIFLWFWLVMAVMGVAIILLETLSHWEPPPEDLRRLAGHVLVFEAETAVQVFEREGKQGLADYLKTFARGPQLVYLLDEQGKDVLGRPVPPSAQELVALAMGSGEVEFKFGRGEAYSAAATKDSQGRRFVLLHELPPRPSGWVLIRIFYGRPLTTILVVLLVSGAVCFWLAQHLTAPVTRLRRAAQKLAAGNLSVRLGTATEGRRDELAELERDFDLMAERIESLMNAQQNLFRDISHELRSPLARLSIALGLARQQSGPASSTALDRIEREADRLNLLIGQLLQLARLETGAETSPQEEINLADLLRDIVADAEFEGRSRNCGVRLVGVEDCVVVGRAELLRSAIENVVRNAVRHTAEGTAVEVGLQSAPDTHGRKAVVSIADHGRGVPDAALPHLFKPFFRAAREAEQERGGAGVGLAITEKAVKLYGGSVSARNVSGGGLLVEIRIPMARSSSQVAV
jgi:two-component system sensor histidine kinase CpxA